MSRKHMGSSVDDFLKEEGIFEEAQAVKEVVAWQLTMKKNKISKNRMALLKTSTQSPAPQRKRRHHAVEPSP
jgi:antitoxin HicB